MNILGVIGTMDFSCQPINNRIRVCCGPENRRECCFADELPQRSDLSINSDLSSSPLHTNMNLALLFHLPLTYLFSLLSVLPWFY